MFQTILR